MIVGANSLSHQNALVARPAHRIVLFFAATGGGVQRVQVTLANAFAARGLEVSCVLPQAKGPFLGQLSEQVALVDLGTRQPLQLVRRLAAYLRSTSPGMLIAAQHHAILAALWARRLTGSSVPVLIVQHNTLSELCRHSQYRMMRWFMPLGARLFFHWADEVCAVSQGVARDLATMTGMPESRVKVVYNPVLSQETARNAALPSGHAWLDAKDRPVVLSVGSLIATKDFATLIRAFAQLRRYRSARLVLLGEGEERERLERLSEELGVAEDVALPGFVPNPFAFMARADVFALSSRVEGLPTVIIEALYCGLPVVATDCPHGPAELLENGAIGRLVPIGDARAFAAALAATLEDPPERRRLTERAAIFSVDHAVERYLALVRHRMLAYGL
jgi:glycosyltransferase involved in cell wall biosynthesis